MNGYGGAHMATTPKAKHLKPSQKTGDALFGVGCALSTVLASSIVIGLTVPIMTSSSIGRGRVSRLAGVETTSIADSTAVSQMPVILDRGVDAKDTPTGDAAAAAPVSAQDAGVEPANTPDESADTSADVSTGAETTDPPDVARGSTDEDVADNDDVADTGAGTDAGACAEASGDAHLGSSGQVWIVRTSDTLTSISAACGVSVDAIANANDIRDVNVIYTGSALIIPR